MLPGCPNAGRRRVLATDEIGTQISSMQTTTQDSDKVPSIAFISNNYFWAMTRQKSVAGR